MDYLQVIGVIASSLISGFVLRKFMMRMHFSYFKYNWTYSGHPGIYLLTRSSPSFNSNCSYDLYPPKGKLS